MLRPTTTVTSKVTPDDIRPLTKELDPTAPGYGNHLSFDAILRRCGLAWTSFLNDLGGFGSGIIVPRLSVDYLSEVSTGTLDIDVSVVRVGTTSFTVLCTVSQDGRPCARVEVVLVCFDYTGRAAVPLTAEQRAALGD